MPVDMAVGGGVLLNDKYCNEKDNKREYKEDKMNYKEISSQEAIDFLLPKHYSGRKPNISKAFGLYDRGGAKGSMYFWKTCLS